MLNPRRVSLKLEGLLAATVYSALTFALAYPLSVNPASSTLPMGSDTDLFHWLMLWDVHALITNPLRIFDANIYHPFRYTLAYSENIIGSSLIAAPVLLATGNAVLALNVVTLMSTVLCGTGTYVLVRRVGFGAPAAAIAGLIFMFAPPRFFRLGQIHLGAIQWIPFALAFLHEYFDTGNRRKLWWACGFFTAQVFSSGHGAVFAAVSIALFAVWRFVLGEPVKARQRLRDVGLPGALLLLVALLPLLPYRAVQREVGLRRTLGDAYAWAPNPATLLASPTYVHRWLMSQWTDWQVLSEAKAFLFPGYLALALGLVGVWTLRQSYSRAPALGATRWTRIATLLEVALGVTILIALVASLTGGFRLRFYGEVIFSARNVGRAWWYAAVVAVARLAMVRQAPLLPGPRLLQLRERYWRWAAARRANAVAFYTLLAVVTFWLSLGPEYWLYWLVYDLPGFNFIRVPTRYSLVTLLALAVLAAAGYESLTSRLGRAARWMVTALSAAILVAEYLATPLNAVPYQVEIPAIDRWLDTVPKPFVVAEFPLGDELDIAAWERRHSLFMLHSTAHWQKTVHGYSGIRPQLHYGLYSEMTKFPDDQSLLGLASVGVGYLVIHTDYYKPGEWAQVEARLADFTNWLTLEKVVGGGRVYSVRKPAPEELLRGRFEDFTRALKAGDIRTLAPFYSLDASLARPGGRMFNGRSAIADWFAQNGEEATSPVLEARSFDGTTGTIRGRFAMGGAGSPTRGEFMQVWKIVEGRWWLAADLFSEDGIQP